MKITDNFGISHIIPDDVIESMIDQYMVAVMLLPNGRTIRGIFKDGGQYCWITTQGEHDYRLGYINDNWKEITVTRNAVQDPPIWLSSDEIGRLVGVDST